MLFRLPRWLSPAVRFRSAGVANTYTPPRFRPSLQPMEDRFCLSLWISLGDTNAGNPANWDNGLPSQTEPADFDGTSSVDCVGLSGDIVVLNLLSGYNGTVTLGGATSAPEFSIASGTLVAPGSLILGVAYVEGGSLQAQSSLAADSLDVSGGSVSVQATATVGDLYLRAGSESVSLESGGDVGYAQVEGGTLDLGAATDTHFLTQTGGMIAQDAGADVTIDGVRTEQGGTAFIWTGGSINEAGNAAKVILTGQYGTASIAPYNAGTVTTGSAMSILDGAYAEFEPGTVFFDGNIGITVENADMFVAANDGMGQEADWTLKGSDSSVETDKSSLTLKTGSTLTVDGPGTWTNDHKQLILEGGTAILMDGVKGKVTMPGTQEGHPVVVDSGLFVMDTGCSLEVTSDGYNLRGGVLRINGAPGAIDTTLTGRLFFEAGSIEYSGNYAIFNVTSNVLWYDGTFKPRITVGTDMVSDVWIIHGSLTIPGGHNPKIAPISEGYDPQEGVNSSFRWRILEFRGSMNVNSTPQIISDGPLYQRYVTSPEPGVTWWLLGVP